MEALREATLDLAWGSNLAFDRQFFMPRAESNTSLHVCLRSLVPIQPATPKTTGRPGLMERIGLRRLAIPPLQLLLTVPAPPPPPTTTLPLQDRQDDHNNDHNNDQWQYQRQLV